MSSNSQIQFFYGDESFLIEEAVRQIQLKTDPAAAENLTDWVEWDRLHQLSAGAGLFAAQKTIFFQDPWFLYKELSAEDETQLTNWFDLIQANGHHLICYIQNQTLDQRRKGVKRLKARASCQEFKSFKDWEQDKTMGWIRTRVKAAGKSIDDDAVYALETTCGPDLRQIAGDIENLIIYIDTAPTIQLADVKAINGGEGASVFDFSEAIKTRKIGELLRILRHLNGQEDPMRLFGLLLSNLRLYLQLLIFKQEQTSLQDMAKKLGKNPYFLKRLVPEISTHYAVSHLTQIFDRFCDIDAAIKTGLMTPRNGLEAAVRTLKPASSSH